MAGEAYYASPGRLPLGFADSEIVEFGPTDALAETLGLLTENLRAAGAPAEGGAPAQPPLIAAITSTRETGAIAVSSSARRWST